MHKHNPKNNEEDVKYIPPFGASPTGLEDWVENITT